MVDTHILQDADIPFAERLHLRVHSLAWISRDVGGMRNFIFPKKVVDYLQLTHAQVESSMRKILDEFFLASTPPGKEALNRALACEHTSHIRHCVLRLRRNELTHQDAIQYAIILESLWDSVNTEMSDATWARCSFHFDTALISLRIVYIILYLRQEFPANAHETAVRSSMFDKVHKSFFNADAPTDDKHDKHSTHFKNLLAAWRGEFELYSAGNFEEKLRSLEHHHGNLKTADILDQFLRQIQVDDGWMLKAYQIVAEFSEGALYRRTGRRRSSGTETAGLPAPRPVEDLDELPFDEDEDGEDKDDGDADYDYKTAVANSAGNSDDEGRTNSRRPLPSRSRPTASRKSPRISRSIARARRSQPSSRPRRSAIRHVKEESDDGDDYVIPVLPSKRRASRPNKRPERAVTILRGVSDTPVVYGEGDDEDDDLEVNGTPSKDVQRVLAADVGAAAAGNTRYSNTGGIDEGDVGPIQLAHTRRRGRSAGREKKSPTSAPRRSGLRTRGIALEAEDGLFDDLTYHPNLPIDTNENIGEVDQDETLEEDGIDGEQVLRALESPEAELSIKPQTDL